MSSDSYPASRAKLDDEVPSSVTTAAELSRLINAAVVNRGFRRLLLSDPARALAAGYNGEDFSLGMEIVDLVLSIRASDLAEFARALTTDYGNDRGQGKQPNNGGF
jgi:hypothetical protein